MRPHASLLAAPAILLLAACADVPTTGPEARAGAAPLLARGTTPISLTVAVHGGPGTYRILPDGLGDYVDGQQGVLAQIDAYGNLQFGSSASPLVRKLVFDFGAPLASSAAVAHGDESDVRSFKIKTNQVLATSTSPRIGDLGVNGTPASACYSVVAAHAHAGMRYEAWYNVAKDARNSHARITRTSTAGPSTWTVVTNDPACGPNFDTAGLYTQLLTTKNAPLVYQGPYSVPFALTLTAR
jgi:hypothetical protein